MTNFDAKTPLAGDIDLETLERISTVPSIDKQVWASKGGFRPHKTSVFNGGFIGDFTEGLGRSLTLGNAVSVAKGISELADTITELGGDEVMVGGVVGSNLSNKLLGRIRGAIAPDYKPADIEAEIVKGNPNVFTNKLDNFGMHLRQRFENMLAEREAERPIQGTAGEFFGNVTSSILAAIALNAIGGVKLAAGAFSVQSAIDTYTASKEAGNPYSDSLAYSVLVGSLSYELEKIGLDKVFKSTYTSGTKFIKDRILASALTEGVTEILQQGVQMGAEYMAGARSDMTVLDAVAELAYAGAAGVVAGGGTATGIAMAQRHNAVSILKNAGVKDAAKVYDEITQQVSNHIVNEVGQEFDFNEASNKIYQEVKNKANKEILGKLYKTLMGEKGITEKEMKQKIEELQSLDPAVEVMNEINAEVISDVVEKTQDKTGEVSGLGKVKTAIKELDSAKQGEEIKLPEPESITFSSKIGNEVREIIKGRLNYLKSEIKNTQSQLKSIERQIKKLEKDGKGTKALENKADRLIDKFFAQLSEYQSIYENPNEVNIREGKVLINANTMVNVLGRSIRNMAKEVTKAYNKGMGVGRGQMRMIRSAITKLVSVKGMTRQAKDYIYRKYNKAMTPEQFMKILPSIQSDIKMIVEEHYKNTFREAINKLANVMLGKNKKGRRVVKLDPRTQQLADEFLDVYTADEIKEEKIIAEVDGTPEKNIRLYAANLATGKNIITKEELNVQDYRNMFEMLHDLVVNGRKSKIFKSELNYQANEKLKEKLVKDIKNKSGDKKTRIGNKLLALGAYYTRTYKALTGLIFRNVGQEIGGSVGEKVLDVKRQLQIAETLRLYWTTELNNVWKDAYGVKTMDEILKLQAEDIDREGVKAIKLSWVDELGEQYHLTLSRAEAREKMMLSYRPEAREKMLKTGWTQEAFDKLKDSLSDKDHKFIMGQLEIMNRMYDPINEVHMKTTGAPLKYSYFYSTIVTERDYENDMPFYFNLLDPEAPLQTSLDSMSQLKMVSKKRVKLKDIPDFQKTAKYIKDMTYYIGMAEKVKQLQQLLLSSEVRGAITDTYGKGVVEAFDKHLRVLARNTTSTDGKSITQGMNRWITRYTQGVLAAKPIQFFKQLTSAFTALDTVPIADYTKYVADIPQMFQDGRAEKFLNDPYIIGRYNFRNMGLDYRYIQELMESTNDKYNTIFNNPTLNKLLFLPVQYGDLGGVLLNGLPVYQHYLNQGMSEEEARQRAIDHIDETQQSGRSTENTAFALSPDPIRRVFTTFTHTPMQYINRVYEILQTIGTDRFDPNLAAKRYFVYFILLPTLYNSISMGFKLPDRDELVEKAFIGVFDRTVIVGPIFEWAFLNMYNAAESAITGEPKKKTKELRVGGLVAGVTKNFNDTITAVNRLSRNGINPVDFFNLTTQVAEATFPVTGSIGGTVREASVSIEGLFRAYEEGDFVTSWRRYLMVLGLSEYATRGGE